MPPGPQAIAQHPIGVSNSEKPSSFAAVTKAPSRTWPWARHNFRQKKADRSTPLLGGFVAIFVAILIGGAVGGVNVGELLPPGARKELNGFGEF
jgi:hypothetical protein